MLHEGTTEWMKNRMIATAKQNSLLPHGTDKIKEKWTEKSEKIQKHAYTQKSWILEQIRIIHKYIQITYNKTETNFKNGQLNIHFQALNWGRQIKIQDNHLLFCKMFQTRTHIYTQMTLHWK